MTIVNKKLMLAGLFLSKFDKKGLLALGFKSLTEAYNTLALTIGGKPASVKNYQQEFDPYFPSARMGWHKRELRPSRRVLLEQYGGLGLEEFLELVSNQFSSSADVDLALNKAVCESGISAGEDLSFARRLATGKAAENYFEEHYRSYDRFSSFQPFRTTDMGCGFDFKLTSPTEEFLAVEVKGLRTATGRIQLTEKEYKMAQYLSSRFYLYVVVDFLHSPHPHVLENPLRSGIGFARKEIKSSQVVWEAQFAA